VIAASIESIWENVLDWEHLPHLHHDSFRSVRLLASTADSWRAIVAMTAELGGSESDIEVTLERPELSYVTRTLEGLGAGTEIVTRLEAVDRATTRIDVDFLLPSPVAEQSEALGLYYRRLYARLWDQDEAMMGERQRQLDRSKRWQFRTSDDERAPIPLGNEASLRSRLPLLIEVANRVYRIIDVAGEILVHSAVCPHMGGPLGHSAIDEHACVTCPWHGYRFDVRSCRSADGRRLKLARAPRVDIDAETGEALLRWAA